MAVVTIVASSLLLVESVTHIVNNIGQKIHCPETLRVNSGIRIGEIAAPPG